MSTFSQTRSRTSGLDMYSRAWHSDVTVLIKVVPNKSQGLQLAMVKIFEICLFGNTTLLSELWTCTSNTYFASLDNCFLFLELEKSPSKVCPCGCIDSTTFLPPPED